MKTKKGLNMSIDQHRQKAYSDWATATDAFNVEIKSVLNGGEYNRDLLREKAEELTMLLNEYRRAWGIL
jgi:hypothetical protein